MGGHSKWSNIKRAKAITDGKRGKAWTKIVKEITIAAKLGGKDPDSNPRLRSAIVNAKASNMPAENIKRGILKGIGELPGLSYEDLVYEGYGPSGVAMLVEVTTDSRNRTGNEIRTLFSKNGGNMGETGCVAWMFSKKGLLCVSKENAKDENALMDIVLELGAEDLVSDADDVFEIYTQPNDLDKIKDGLSAKGISVASAEVTMKPANTVPVGEADAAQVLNLMELLEDHDDVNNVYSNFDIPDQVLAKIG